MHEIQRIVERHVAVWTPQVGLESHRRDAEVVFPAPVGGIRQDRIYGNAFSWYSDPVRDVPAHGRRPRRTTGAGTVRSGSGPAANSINSHGWAPASRSAAAAATIRVHDVARGWSGGSVFTTHHHLRCRRLHLLGRRGRWCRSAWGLEVVQLAAQPVGDPGETAPGLGVDQQRVQCPVGVAERGELIEAVLGAGEVRGCRRRHSRWPGRGLHHCWRPTRGCSSEACR